MKAVVLSLLCLTMFAGSASAECAWVLWEDTFLPTNKTSTELVRAYTTKHDCDGGLAEVLATFTSSPGQTVRKDTKRQETFVTVGESITGYRYVCLPDTVDPRGSKGQ